MLYCSSASTVHLLAMRGDAVSLSRTCGLQVYLQEFAWTESQRPAAIAQRADHAQHAAERALLTKEPMFCFQTALAMHRWSCLAYMGACMSPLLLRLGMHCKPLTIHQ